MGGKEGTSWRAQSGPYVCDGDHLHDSHDVAPTATRMCQSERKEGKTRFAFFVVGCGDRGRFSVDVNKHPFVWTPRRDSVVTDQEVRLTPRYRIWNDVHGL